MFFIFGISNGQKKLDFSQSMVCPHCGRYGRYEAFMEYYYFSLFFIPIVKWNKKYYIVSTCCNSVYSISNELGIRIARGEVTEIREEDLVLVRRGSGYMSKRCSNCGFEADDDFQFCPKCGKPL